MPTKTCYEKILPHEELKPIRTWMALGRGGHDRAVMPIAKRWSNGVTIRVRFLNGSSDQHEFVRRHAVEWMKHANLLFEFGDDPRAEVRITFNDDGAWSYVGTDNLRIPLHAATMNFGWLDEGTVLHEFGHMIGLGHEHSNPEGGLRWNREVVIRDLSGPPNFWDEATIEHNVFHKFAIDQINGTEFDPASIMLYAFPSSWVQGGQGTNSNEVLSELDKAFVASMYPKAEVEDEIPVLPINEMIRTAAAIGRAGEEDRFAFSVEREGEFEVFTSGNTDLVMKLYGPDDDTRLIAEDDDSGEARNSRILAALGKGRYLVQIRHYNLNSGTGEYLVAVNRKN